MRLRLRDLAALRFMCVAICAPMIALPPGPAAADDLLLTPLTAHVLSAPTPFAGSDGRRHLVYELRLADAAAGVVELRHIDVVDQGTGKTLLGLDRSGIARRFALGGRRGAESADLGVAQFGVLFVHVAIEAGAPLPRALVHRISLRLAPPGIDLTMTIGEVEVSDRPPIVLGPPLIGTGYIAGDGCCDSIRHVRALLPINGRFALAQRFAIDWEQVDSGNHLLGGDPKVLSNYVIYGKNVLAVADGTVISARNDLPEQVPGALPTNLPIAEADGNFVVLDIGGGAYVLFAHMQPRSVTVTAGAKVKRGALIGKVGNSGNSQAPHLHLHVMDRPSPLVADGLPYVLDAFTLVAVDRLGTADFDKAEATGAPLALTKVLPPQRLRDVMPLDLSVVDLGP